MNRRFSNEDIWMTNRHIKTCTPSLDHAAKSLSVVSDSVRPPDPQTAAHQAPPSLGSSKQEHWSGLPFPSPMNESEVSQSCLTPSEPMDCNLPSSSVHGICQSTGVGCYCLLYHQLPACSNSCPSSW